MKFVQNFLLSHRANRRAKRAAAKKHIPKKLLNGFLKDFQNFNSRAINKNLTPALEKDIYPYLFEKTETKSFEPHYTYHTAWAARILAKTSPVKHYDISSHTMFATICSAFVPFEYADIRLSTIQLDGLNIDTADLTKLPYPDASIDSISCMHVTEHIGLGRYGDKIDPEGDKRAMSELVRVVAPKGQLIFVVPVGKPRIVFNAHRIYDFETIKTAFSNFKLKEFTLISTKGEPKLIRNANPDLVKKETWGCGCFHFIK